MDRLTVEDYRALEIRDMDNQLQELTDKIKDMSEQLQELTDKKVELKESTKIL